jgi:hypothetical protein
MDKTLRDPQAVAPVGLDPETVERLWRAFLEGHQAFIGRESGRSTLSSDGAMVPLQPRLSMRRPVQRTSRIPQAARLQNSEQRKRSETAAGAWSIAPERNDASAQLYR